MPRRGDFNEDLRGFDLDAFRSTVRVDLVPQDVVRMGQNHSHSSILGYVNALIFQRNFFIARRDPNCEPTKFLGADFQQKIARFRFNEVSATIDNDWSILFASSITQRIARQRKKYRHRFSTISNHSPSARTPSLSLSTISTA